MLEKANKKLEFGDFQTPLPLARKVLSLLRDLGVDAAAIVEPNCGKGSFLKAASEAFPREIRIIGFDINPEYVNNPPIGPSIEVYCEDFFAKDWFEMFRALPDPVLVIGNPPWVTNAAVSKMAGTNLPPKSNIQKMRGIDAITGKSNFDISEWMILHLLDALAEKNSVLSMLCKTSVARKVLKNVWSKGAKMSSALLYKIDATQYFGTSVDACLLICRMDENTVSKECTVYSAIGALQPESTFALKNGAMVADTETFNSYGYLLGKSSRKWRSGIKHDCSPVMELRRISENTYTNSLTDVVELEYDFIYPMLKSSDLMRDNLTPSRYMVVPQLKVGDDTDHVKWHSPQTWSYLCKHANLLDSRASSIYRNRPQFSVFGIGPYAFAPWKVAISGLYKSLNFRCIGPFENKPVVLDDTCYFLPCRTESDAQILLDILNSEYAQGLFRSLVFWDTKRPVTAHLLESLDIEALAAEMQLVLPVWLDDGGTLSLNI